MGTENKRVLEHHRQHSLRIEGIPDERVAVINRWTSSCGVTDMKDNRLRQ